MTSRKDQLKNMFQPVAPVGEALPQRAASGAVKAMGLSLGGLQREVNEARQLKDSLHEGERIVEISPALIDSSPYSDRLSDGAVNDEEFAALVQSMRDSGQQVPVLLRPHSKVAGRFESAYGHRRINAARQLDIPVKAIVRALDDVELVLAQGKENSERRNLSFIEKSFFARNMIEAGVDRGVAMAALGVHKTEMTRYIQVANAIPYHIVRDIGPAPKIGRPRWLALGELLQGDAARIKSEDETSRAEFVAANSDRRFQMLFDRLSRKAAPKAEVRVVEASGVAVSVSDSGKTTRFDIADSGFAMWLEANLTALAARFVQGKDA